MKSNIIDKTSLENFRGHNCFILNFYNFQTCTSTNFYGHINRYFVLQKKYNHSFRYN